MRHAWLFILGMAAAAAAGAAMPLQPLLDATPSGGTLTLAPGDYAGPATVDRPMIVEGHGAASLGNLGKGTVLTVHTRRATIRGLTIRGSGSPTSVSRGRSSDGSRRCGSTRVSRRRRPISMHY